MAERIRYGGVMSTSGSLADRAGQVSPDCGKRFSFSFHLRRISLWLRLSVDLSRDGEFIEP